MNYDDKRYYRHFNDKPNSHNNKKTYTGWNLHKLITCLIILFIIYIVLGIYNGIMTDKAFDVVNAYSHSILGYDVLIDKGVVGHAWHYITTPTDNFNELLRDHDTRVSYAAAESLGVWNLSDFMPNVDNAGVNNYNFNNDGELFKIIGLELTNIENGSLWSDVTFSFEFISNNSLDEYRDSTGKISLCAYIEYCKADNTVEISQTYNMDILNDNRYSKTIPCFDTDLSRDKIISVTLYLFGFYDYGVRIVL